jgi:1,4-alpha-glucan branching enzyme
METAASSARFSADVESVPGGWDGLPCHGTCSIGPYSALIDAQ